MIKDKELNQLLMALVGHLLNNQPVLAYIIAQKLEEVMISRGI